MIRHNPRGFAAKLCRYARAASDLAVASVRNQVYAYKGRTIERFVLFVGYARSGSTLVGALLNAHPEMVVSNEAHVLHHLEYSKGGGGGGGIVCLILNKERKVCKRTCSYSKKMSYGYAYGVKNQWQGKYSRLRVIGDKGAGKITEIAHARPELLDFLRSQIKVPVHALFICRNPYDMIAAQCLRRLQRKEDRAATPLSDFGLEEAEKPKLGQEDVSGVVERSAELVKVLSLFPEDKVFSMRHEDFTASPKDKLRGICAFLGVECTEDYLTDCAAIVHSSPHQTRFKVQWTPGQIQEVAAAVKKYPWLEGYAFDSA